MSPKKRTTRVHINDLYVMVVDTPFIISRSTLAGFHISLQGEGGFCYYVNSTRSLKAAKLIVQAELDILRISHLDATGGYDV